MRVLVGRHLQRQALVHAAVGEPVELGRAASRGSARPRSVASLSASLTRSSVSMRVATYIVVTGTSARSASTTELRPVDDLARAPWPPRWTGPAAAHRPPGLRRGHRTRLRRDLGALVRRGGTRGPRPWASGPCPRGRGGAGRRSRRSRPSLLLRMAPRRWELPGMSGLLACRWCGRSLRGSDQWAPVGVSSIGDAGRRQRVADRVGRGEVPLLARAAWRASSWARDERVERHSAPASVAAAAPSQCAASGLMPSTSVIATTAPRRGERRLVVAVVERGVAGAHGVVHDGERPGDVEVVVHRRGEPSGTARVPLPRTRRPRAAAARSRKPSMRSTRRLGLVERARRGTRSSSGSARRPR